MGGQDPWWKGTKWDFPKGTPEYWANGIPWSTFEDGKPPPGDLPLTYEPPQWKHQGKFTPYRLFESRLNLCGKRSPLFASFPCCFADCIAKCCIPNSEYVSTADPDAWMTKMLSTGTSPKCPEMMKGIFWLCDNDMAHEVLMCFHDCDWATDKVALKTYHHNYAV